MLGMTVYYKPKVYYFDKNYKDMIKNFEEFVKIPIKSLDENVNVDYDYMEQHVRLVQECAAYNVKVVKENGGIVDLKRPMAFIFFSKYNRDFVNVIDDTVVAFELGNQSDADIFADNCNEEIIYTDEEGDFLVAITDSGNRWVIDHMTCPDDFIFEMFSNIEYDRR